MPFAVRLFPRMLVISNLLGTDPICCILSTMDIDEDVQSRDLKLEEWAKEDTPARKKYELKLMMKFDK